MKKRIIISLFLCVTMPILAFFISSAIIDAFAAAPELQDEVKVRAFLELQDGSGKTNAMKLGIDNLDDSSEWSGFVFNANRRLVSIWYTAMLHGTLDMSGCTELVTIFANSSIGSEPLRPDYCLSAIDISGCTALENLYIDGHRLTALDVTQNPALKVLFCCDNNLKTLDVSQNPALSSLHCDYNELESLDVSGNPALANLTLSDNIIGNLDLSHNPLLVGLDCGYNELTNLDLSHNPLLANFDCSFNELTNLDVTHNTALAKLNCSVNPLGTLNVSQNEALTMLVCVNNGLNALDISQNTKLTYLNCSGNFLGNLDVGKNTALTYLSCVSCNLSKLDVSSSCSLSELICYNNPSLKYINVSGNNSSAFFIYWKDNTAANRLNLSESPLNGNDRLTNANIISLILFPYGNLGMTQVSVEVNIEGSVQNLSQAFSVVGAAPQYLFAQAHKNYAASGFDGWMDENGDLITVVGSGVVFNNTTDVMRAFLEPETLEF